MSAAIGLAAGLAAGLLAVGLSVAHGAPEPSAIVAWAVFCLLFGVFGGQAARTSPRWPRTLQERNEWLRGACLYTTAAGAITGTILAGSRWAGPSAGVAGAFSYLALAGFISVTGLLRMASPLRGARRCPATAGYRFTLSLLASASCLACGVAIGRNAPAISSALIGWALVATASMFIPMTRRAVAPCA